ncbi:CYTH and CHAD domain-containing protein [Streptomyces sp. SID3343]|uniref:CYTH and CHAD domain-containing protein n=1 Tax=Streptomyces sp. SID3343 TaxID=2690260 RepID=UPI00136FD75A|nr:CYTH and CHAD domain-containing protein [Streptomyces sp. SID3343]MYW01336.1 CHAD domain-containing protein [Streptomyces sp. SID3343]
MDRNERVSDTAEVVREVERKYEAAEGVDLPDFTGVTKGLRVGAGETVELDAVYYDTADLVLAGHGVTLRRRVGGSDAGWHLKLPAGADARDEVRAAATPDGAAVPAQLALRVRALTRGAALEPIVRLRTVREVSLARRGDEDRVLAEIARDAVTAQVLGETAPGTSFWSEVEVELVEGGPKLLDALDARLAKGGWRRSDAPSKLAHALAEAGHTPAGRAPDRSPATAGGLALAYVREQIDAITAYDPRVRLDEEDAVHRMRVATRRLRSALRVFSRVFDQGRARPLGAELKWLAGELGTARDHEVLAARLRARIDELPTESVLGPVVARLTSWDARERTDARARVLTELDGARYFALLTALDAFVADPPFTREAAKPARKPAAKAVHRTDRRLAKRARTALAADPGRDRDRALHEARKAAKRVRYAGEATRPAFGKPAKRLAKHAKDLQNLLGAHQDSVQTRRALRRLAIAANAAGESAFTWGLLYGREEAEAERLERQFPYHWDDFAGRRHGISA